VSVFTVINPATARPVTDVHLATVEDTDAAIENAQAAFPAWRAVPPGERATLLRRFAAVVDAHVDELAELEVRNAGHTWGNARWEAGNVRDCLNYYAGAPERLFGRQIPVAGGVDVTFHEPLGVVGIIVPWNFPMPIAGWGFAPALAAGNTVVLKPASTTPLSAMLFADVCLQADLPPGTVNIVTGPGEIGMHLATHKDVDKVAFTGSTEIGKKIGRGVAGSDKALTLELGGKAANIVFDDAPLDQAVEGIVNGIDFNQGEVCCAGSRLLVQESIADTLVDKLKDRLSTIRVGDPLDKNTDVGAINSKNQLEKITELVASGVAEGADLYQPACDLPDRGYFFRPTLFTNVAQSHRIAREEIFGPVLSVLTFRTPDEAVEKANNTPYGLSAGVWTDKGSRILDIVSRMQAGVVWANTFNKFDPTSPFGGYKESGFGREGGMHGLHAYVRLEDR
jgi:aldehyde dehydrogenase (NAD+)